MKAFYMADPTQPDLLAELQKMLPGFFGTLVAVLMVQRPRNWSELLASAVSGVATAYFLAPPIAAFMQQSTPEGIAAVGFGTGISAVVVMPSLMRRIQELASRWSGSWPPKFDPPTDRGD